MKEPISVFISLADGDPKFKLKLVRQSSLTIKIHDLLVPNLAPTDISWCSLEERHHKKIPKLPSRKHHTSTTKIVVGKILSTQDPNMQSKILAYIQYLEKPTMWLLMFTKETINEYTLTTQYIFPIRHFQNAKVTKSIGTTNF